jgi:heat shock protein 1/8
MPGHCIGIDLGTTYSCVAVMKGGMVHIIANDQGNRTTPSYVGFTETERLIGESAKNQCSTNPQNTIFDVKRMLGRLETDTNVIADKERWPFPILSDQEGKLVVQVSHLGQLKVFTPEEISSMILVKMKQTAEDFLGEPVTDAVITVPAYFNDQQRQATKDAGTIAGLDVKRIINEPTAAAIAYGILNHTTPESERIVLIFDLGGGTFDVSILSIMDGVFEVKATAGDTHLGGEDFDRLLIDHCVQEFEKKHRTSSPIHTSPRAISRLRTECERVKRVLSSQTESTLQVDSLWDGIDFSLKISRAKFESMCMTYFQSIMVPVQNVLTDARMTKDQIQEIVLVGGSTRIPKIQQLLKEFFDGKELCQSINADEAVAYGAAVQAAILGGNPFNDSVFDDILLIDVAPLSLGIETSGGIMTTIIDRNTVIPCKKKQIFSTYLDNQRTVSIQIYEGERTMTLDNHMLGTFNLTDIPAAPRGIPEVEVTFDLDANGILKVSAQEQKTKVQNQIIISNDSRRLNKTDIEKMIQEAEIYQDIDHVNHARNKAKNILEGLCYSCQETLENENENETENESHQKKDLLLLIQDIMEWMENNPHGDVLVYEEKEVLLRSSFANSKV